MYRPTHPAHNTMSGSPIIEYTHELIVGKGGTWAEHWSPGDVHVCWQDGCEFDWFPVPVPTGYDETRRTYTVFGTFCCWQCAKRWQMDNPSFNSPIARCWLATMAKEFFGYKHDVITPAPKRWVLLSKQMTIDEYRTHCGANVPCETVHPPLLPACMAHVSGRTSAVLESIYTTRNNESIGNHDTNSSTSPPVSIYEKYLSSQRQPSAEEAQLSVGNGDGANAIPKNNLVPGNAAAAAAAPPPKKKKKRADMAKPGGTLASYMRK